MYKLFRDPVAEELTVIGADPAEGGDFCAAVAKSRKHNDTFMTFQARMGSDQFGHELYRMALYIKQKTRMFPVIAVERNTGMATISVLQSLNYGQLFRMPKWGEVLAPGESADSEKIGWHTNAATRPKMLDDLAGSLRQNINHIYDVDIVREIMSFIRNQRTGRPEAAPGAHDDFVFAEAIAWQALQRAPMTQSGLGMGNLISQFPKQDLFDKNGVPNV